MGITVDWWERLPVPSRFDYFSQLDSPRMTNVWMDAGMGAPLSCFCGDGTSLMGLDHTSLVLCIG
jgi:hypothetical protein